MATPLGKVLDRGGRMQRERLLKVFKESEIGALTDNVGGTVSTTLAAIPDPADGPATADALRDDLVANVLPKVRNAVSSLASLHNNSRLGSKMWMLEGTNAANSNVALVSNGGLKFTTAGANADQMILSPRTSGIADQGVNTSRQPWFEAVLLTDAAVTLMTLLLGFKATNVVDRTTDANQAMFFYDPAVNSGKWTACSSNNGSHSPVASSPAVTVAAATIYGLRCEVDADRVPHYYVSTGLLGDWKRVAKGAALKANTTLKPFMGLQAGEGAAKAVTLLGDLIVFGENVA